jgi:predicted nucleic acid-binding protein
MEKNGIVTKFMTSKKVFFDTNILAYAFDQADLVKQDISKRLIADSIQTRNGNISTQVLQEFYVICTTKIGIPQEMVLTGMDSIEPLHIVVITPEIIRSAIKKQTKFLLSFWDALIMQAAETSLSTIIYTEDLNHGQVYDTIEVVNPFL